jgi:superfamily II DNA or RNA helicase
MFLLITSNKQLSLIELATGTGKSVMLALMAQYFNTILGKKVLVLVPSEVLKLDQTCCYCTNYSKAEAQLYESDVPAIYYSTFEDVLSDGRIP